MRLRHLTWFQHVQGASQQTRRKWPSIVYVDIATIIISIIRSIIAVPPMTVRSELLIVVEVVSNNEALEEMKSLEDKLKSRADRLHESFSRQAI